MCLPKERCFRSQGLGVVRRDACLSHRRRADSRTAATSPHSPRRGRRGQGLLVPRQPRTPAHTWHQGSHPGKEDQAANRKKRGSTGGRPVSHDIELYKERNTVERLINKLKAWRGIATRYDKTPASYLAGLHLRGAMIWIKDLATCAEAR